MMARIIGMTNPIANFRKLMPSVFTTESQKYLSDMMILKLSKPTHGAESIVSMTV